MLKFEITMNETNILQKNEYKPQELYDYIIESFTEKGIEYVKGSEPAAMIFKDRGTEQDYAKLWATMWDLTQTTWFIKYADKILWYNSDDGENEDDFSIEDFLQYYKGKYCK